MEQAEIDQAVASLLGDFESWREYSLMQEPFAPGTEDEAYAIQAGFMGRVPQVVDLRATRSPGQPP